MSLTQAETVFASIHETAINDMLVAFCTSRPRYLYYGSPAFTPSTSVTETQVDAIAFPGVPGGIQWRIALSVPRIDLFKQNDRLPPELALGPGQFSLEVSAELCIECRKIKIDARPQNPDQRRDKSHEKHDKPVRDDTHPLSELTCFKLQVFGIGHLEQVIVGSETGISFTIDALEIVDIKPEELEAFLECLMFMILQPVLAGIRFPLSTLRAGAFQLVPTVGPMIEEDQIKMRGTV